MLVRQDRAHTLTPATPVIVDAAHSYDLDLGDFKNFDNGFCSAVVTYDTNG